MDFAIGIRYLFFAHFLVPSRSPPKSDCVAAPHTFTSHDDFSLNNRLILCTVLLSFLLFLLVSFIWEYIYLIAEMVVANNSRRSRKKGRRSSGQSTPSSAKKSSGQSTTPSSAKKSSGQSTTPSSAKNSSGPSSTPSAKANKTPKLRDASVSGKYWLKRFRMRYFSFWSRPSCQ